MPKFSTLHSQSIEELLPPLLRPSPCRVAKSASDDPGAALKRCNPSRSPDSVLKCESLAARGIADMPALGRLEPGLTDASVDCGNLPFAF